MTGIAWAGMYDLSVYVPVRRDGVLIFDVQGKFCVGYWVRGDLIF